MKYTEVWVLYDAEDCTPVAVYSDRDLCDQAIVEMGEDPTDDNSYLEVYKTRLVEEEVNL